MNLRKIEDNYLKASDKEKKRGNKKEKGYRLTRSDTDLRKTEVNIG